MNSILSKIPREPSSFVSAIPLITLGVFFLLIILISGPLAISDYSPYALLGAAAVCLILSIRRHYITRRSLAAGLRRSAGQILPAIPMLLCIATLSTSWMLSGVVPTLIDYGLMLLNPHWFLATACLICAMVSVLTGSSWSTIATIGVAFLGIGTAMGYSPGWTAGAIISGAYFGDKVSPLSDTTVIASSTCGVDLFTHIRYMMITTVPAMVITLAIFTARGLTGGGAPMTSSTEILTALGDNFNLTPWTFVIPAITFLLIALRVPTLWVLVCGTIFAVIGIFVFQPQAGMGIADIGIALLKGFEPASGVESFDRLVSTGGITGIMPVVFLVGASLIFGWMMISSGMLASVAGSITRRLRSRVSAVAATLATGFTLNAATADQYISIIITGNVYRTHFRRRGLEQRLLSRTLEDGVSVTSPIIPWSSCGVTQSSVLGVPTLVYMPYCLFNYLTPVVSLLVIATGFKVRRLAAETRRA